MRKEIINPETGDWAEHEVAYAEGVAVQLPGAKRVFLSGIVAEGETIEAQTRSTLEYIEGLLSEYGGGMEDVVRVRVFISRPQMDEETLETVHDVRNEFFLREHLPASTLVEVEDLVDDDYMIEIDADAVIPEEGWETEQV
ncbi:RidA family protein [Natronomonas sp. F2-12]|jgi:enamine deaminase RidA (YjgF/YER057c/UK114 family)|uniref:RidA family protein n=1 Tax=Natronomonas aquatica TaxID=2841590 RepID=A0A9R1D7P7_9EURY|nr:RidA family protein [Natronomonas aquatica]MCQ4333955.1 RidA family protein [Natronomonas aquatica]